MRETLYFPTLRGYLRQMSDFHTSVVCSGTSQADQRRHQSSVYAVQCCMVSFTVRQFI
jgi:hypothetical protein